MRAPHDSRSKVIMRAWLIGFWVVVGWFGGVVGACAETPGAPNFEVHVKAQQEEELTDWTGQIFTLANAQACAQISPETPAIELPVGNYALTLQFKIERPELKTLRPFPFGIKAGQKTILTLAVGPAGPVGVEKDVLRTTIGEDYVNFFLPSPDPNLCKVKCEKDRNCGSYTYCYRPQKQTGQCYLIHGPGTPGPSHPGEECLSEALQKDPSPYRVTVTMQPLAAPAE